MRKKYEQLQAEVSMDSLVERVRQKLLSLPDPRNRSIGYSFHDLVMSGFAMFSLKYPSLHQFEHQTNSERENLHHLYQIEQLCTDAYLRKTLDAIDPSSLRELYVELFHLLKGVGVLKEYSMLDGQLICSVDGVQHFCSNQVHCSHCQERHHQNGKVTYSHSMLCAALVHPDQREVFLLGSEPILKQDGQDKNDCERNAAERLLDWMREHYQGCKLLFVEDALYANGPHLRRILKEGWNFIVNVKPSSHKALFRLFESRKQQRSVKSCTIQGEKGYTHRFWWDNNLPLNEAASDVRINFLYYEQESPSGQIQRFSWATSIPLSRANVERIMRIGRSRWKIENETFNTLKNQGYHFEHNYGHGYQFLSTALAYLMLLAFLVDQIFQRCSPLFQRIWQAAKTKRKLWELIRSVFSVRIVFSFKELYFVIAEQFNVQLE